MNLIEAIVSQPNKDCYYIYRRRHDWYLKINKYESVKYFIDGRKHTVTHLTLEDYLAGDWIEFVR